jgi:hypothetical protein
MVARRPCRRPCRATRATIREALAPDMPGTCQQASPSHSAPPSPPRRLCWRIAKKRRAKRCRVRRGPQWSLRNAFQYFAPAGPGGANVTQFANRVSGVVMSFTISRRTYEEAVEQKGIAWHFVWEVGKVGSPRCGIMLRYSHLYSSHIG